MSTSTDPDSRASSLELRDSQAAEPFLSVVWDNPEVCSNCFTRCKTVAKGSYISRNTGDEYDVEDHYLEEQGVVGVANVNPLESTGADAGVHRQRATCAECGSVRLLQQHDNLSVREACRRIDALAGRLEDAGHVVDRTRMRAAICHLKKETRWHSHDREIFAVASYVAIESQ